MKKSQRHITLLSLSYLLIFQTPLAIQVIHHYAVHHDYHVVSSQTVQVNPAENSCPIHNFDFASFLATETVHLDYFPVNLTEQTIELISQFNKPLFHCYLHRAPPKA